MRPKHFRFTLLAIVAIVGAVSIVTTTDLYRPASVTRVDNIEILGTTQATGLVTAAGNVVAGSTDSNTQTFQGETTIKKTGVNSRPKLSLQNDALSWEVYLDHLATDNLTFKSSAVGFPALVLNSSTGLVFVTADLTVGGLTTLGNANADFTAIWGHAIARGTAPTDSASCDGSSSATVVGTDRNFAVTTGVGATACTMTFSRTWTVKPVCTVFPEGSITLPTCTITATAITCTIVAASQIYHWKCEGTTGAT